MAFFANPRNLVEAFGLVIHLFRFTGLFPFYFCAATNKFQLSWKLLSITGFHLMLYAYVNITSLLENWHDYSQPMIGHSSLTAIANLILRLLDIFLTLCIFVPPLVGNRLHIGSLNLYIKIIDELILMDIDVTCVYQRVYYLSFGFLFVWLLFMSMSAWHSIYFFELITERPPELKYYLVVTLSNFYKFLFMFYGNAQFFAIFMISKQLNSYLEELLRQYREKFESGKSVSKSELDGKRVYE